MTAKQIEGLLKQWSQAVLRVDELHAKLTPDQLAQRWAGEPPATTDSIIAAQERLGFKLPADYIAFLKCSNGWRFLDGDRHLRDVSSIQPLAQEQPEIIATYGTMRGELGDLSEDAIKSHHFRSLVQISDDADGLYLINPKQSVSRSKATYFFANWVPGEEFIGSFSDLLQTRFDTFVAAHGVLAGSSKTQRPKIKLNVPPIPGELDPRVWVAKLDELGYFIRTPDRDKASMMASFVAASEKLFADRASELRDGNTPLKALISEDTGRLAWWREDRLALEGATYANELVGPLLASWGVDLPEFLDEKADEWVLRLGDFTARVAKLKNGNPRGLGMEHVVNRAQAVANAVSKTLNRWLASSGSDIRVSDVSWMEPFGSTRSGLIVLDDPLSYELMWCECGGCYCRVIRADVF